MKVIKNGNKLNVGYPRVEVCEHCNSVIEIEDAGETEDLGVSLGGWTVREWECPCCGHANEFRVRAHTTSASGIFNPPRTDTCAYCHGTVTLGSIRDCEYFDVRLLEGEKRFQYIWRCPHCNHTNDRVVYQKENREL